MYPRVHGMGASWQLWFSVKTSLTLIYFCIDAMVQVTEVSCTMASLGCMRFVPFVQFYVFPRAVPSGIHKTALRVQIPYINPSKPWYNYTTCRMCGQCDQWV